MKQQSLYLLLLTSILIISSCKKELKPSFQNDNVKNTHVKSDPTEKYNTYKGPTVLLGGGYARSWIRMNHLNVPIEIGAEISEVAMQSLPHNFQGLVLPLHKKAIEATPFEHVGLDYQPHGHHPPGVFDVPHFDAHFYLMTLADRMSIPPVNPSTLPLFQLVPPVGYLPLSYSMGGPERQMGQHWAPPPPSFLPFSHVMIYGTYYGQLTFIEPMVTIAHLLSGGSTQTYLQPQKFAEAGNYPTRYNIYRDDKGAYQITLSDFVFRLAH